MDGILLTAPDNQEIVTGDAVKTKADIVQVVIDGFTFDVVVPFVSDSRPMCRSVPVEEIDEGLACEGNSKVVAIEVKTGMGIVQQDETDNIHFSIVFSEASSHSAECSSRP